MQIITVREHTGLGLSVFGLSIGLVSYFPSTLVLFLSLSLFLHTQQSCDHSLSCTIHLSSSVQFFHGIPFFVCPSRIHTVLHQSRSASRVVCAPSKNVDVRVVDRDKTFCSHSTFLVVFDQEFQHRYPLSRTSTFACSLRFRSRSYIEKEKLRFQVSVICPL